MARTPRLVVPGYPHYVTQHGNRHQRTFFTEDNIAITSPWYPNPHARPKPKSAPVTMK
jgi:hypothetical protein